MPQSKQTTISGNTHATGLSMLFSPGKWMPISPVNLRWLTEPHDGHAALRTDARSSAITVEFAMIVQSKVGAKAGEHLTFWVRYRTEFP